MKKIFPLILIIVGIPFLASAATITVSMQPKKVGVGDTVRITVLLSSETPVNAFGGTLTCTQNLSPQRVDNGNSIVSAWITNPAIEDTTIEFAGITPGGFAGIDGTLFNIQLKAEAAGEATCRFENLQILRNDGAGTEEPVTASDIHFTILAASQGSAAPLEDTESPESFLIYRGADLSLFEGQPYVTFSAHDKISGIERYEIKESRLPLWLLGGSWDEAAIPYEIRDTYGTSNIYVQAIDNAGNERVEV